MKKLFILFCLLFICSFLPVFAKSTVQDETTRLEYMNLEFWNRFNDEVLVSNLTAVYKNNHDLKAAVLKVKQAQRVVKMSFANELPHIGFSGYAGHTFRSSDQVFGGLKIPDYTESQFLFPLTMNYEVDIWGENRLKTKSKQKQLEMIEQDERSAYIMISSAFTCYYYNLVKIDKLIDYQFQLVRLQEQVVKSLETRYELGTSTISDVERAKKDLSFFKENLEVMLGNREAIKNQLNVLLSNNDFDDIKRTSYDDMKVYFAIPDGLDLSSLEKRPDRIKAELDLKKIGIDVKIAKRDLFPKFIITGNLGFNLYNISSAHKFLADIGVVPAWDLFMGGRKIQMLKLKKDTYNIAIEHYEKTILTSIQEANDALFGLKTAINVDSVVDERFISEEKEMNYTKIKEAAGVLDNLDLMLQEEKLIITKQQQVSAKINKIISAVNLYQALGGVDFTNNL